MCDYIVKRDDTSSFVALRERNQSFILHLTNIDDLSQLFFDFKKECGVRAPREDPKRMKDSFLSYLRGNKGLVKVGSGIDIHTSFLQYRVKDEDLLVSLRRSYPVEGNLDKVI